MSNFEFKVGDRVKCTFFGDRIFTLIADGSFLLLENKRELFLYDGKHQKSHTHPVLTLVERPKVKVKVTLWANLYKGGVAEVSYKTEALARRNAQELAIGCVKLTGEYEA